MTNFLKHLTFIITCKNRLEHVKQTLPKIANIKIASIVFVDYGCPQHSGLWVKSNYPSVNVIHVNDDSNFCLARARNIGASHTNSPWLFFIDADILVNENIESWLSSELKDNYIYRASLVNGERIKDTWGTFICSSNLFKFLGGYDEVFRGWGGEDVDIYKRITKLNVTTHYFPSIYISPIKHSDLLRTNYHGIKDKYLHQIINELYLTSKSYFSAELSGEKQLPFTLRNELMNSIIKKVLEWDKIKRPSNFTLQLKISDLKWLPSSYKMKVNLTLQLTID